MHDAVALLAGPSVVRAPVYANLVLMPVAIGELRELLATVLTTIRVEAPMHVNVVLHIV